MIGAYNSYGYYYINHNNKYVCFMFNSEKRVKTKVLKFLKEERQEGKIKNYLKTHGLDLVLTHKSKKYLMYDIIDLKEVY